MTSQIVPSNIDGTFPVAGQDNSSQGFRDNFTNTKNNFQFAADEISDLQSKVLVKSALSGSTLDNDMAGSLIGNVLTQGYREKVYDFGTVSGAQTVNFSLASYFTITLANSVTFTFSNVPSLGTNAANYSIKIEITVPNVGYTVTLPSSVTKNAATIAGWNANTITFTETGTFTFEFTTVDSGVTYSIFDRSRSRDTVQGGSFTVTNTVANATVNGITMTVNTSGIGNITATNFIGNIITTGSNSAVFTGTVTAANITAPNISGNLTTSVQTNITQVGNLTSLIVSGNITAGNITVSGMSDACGGDMYGVRFISATNGGSTSGSNTLYPNIGFVVINPTSSTIATYTVTMPAGASNGQVLRLAFANTITTLTHSGAGSDVVYGSFNSTTVNTALGGTWIYAANAAINSGNGVWYRIG